MLLRSRRRPLYSTEACAVISALLLLLSVSLLYSRLSHSQSPTHSHYHRRDPEFPSDLLVSDTEDDSDAALTDDDKIDELDIVDEDANPRGSGEDESEEDEDPSNQVKKSGFYFDHVTGAIRRSFDKKRSIKDWADDSLGFASGSDALDWSKFAIGSDDVMVDDEVRRKATEVMGIEDALLLKVGGRASPLRGGWGDWFDKKGDFLRRDRMFKSNLEILNPLNNPILQDPDGLGVTGLTRGDRIVQKWWLDEFKRVPFLLKQPLSISGNVREVKLEKNKAAVNVADNVREIRGGIKGEKRRSLKENASSRGWNEDDDTINGLSGQKFPSSDEVPNSNSGRNSYDKNNEGSGTTPDKSRLLNHIYADGKRWGYYPGLHMRQSFSNFMEAFFRRGKCDMRVFMVWNSPTWMFSVRHQRGLESLLFHHKDACVVVFSETIELDFFKTNFVKDGYKIAVAMPNLDELLKNTPTHIFASVWHEWRKTKFYPTHYSELVRLAALYKYGGIYLDSDIIVLNPISSLKNSVGMEDQLPESYLNGAVMAFRRHSPFIKECLKEFYMTYDDTLLKWNGAELITRVARSILNKEDTSTKQLELNVQPSSMFFPISSNDISRYFSAPETETQKAQQDALFRKLVDESLTFHFWNSLTIAFIPEPGSLVSRLINHACIRCSDAL